MAGFAVTTAEVCWLAPVYEGKLQTTRWEDRQSAEKKYRTEIVASDLVLLGSREKGNGSRPALSDKAEKGKPPARAVGAPESSDDDLPFWLGSAELVARTVAPAAVMRPSTGRQFSIDQTNGHGHFRIQHVRRERIVGCPDEIGKVAVRDRR